jgi:hypothetical protein
MIDHVGSRCSVVEVISSLPQYGALSTTHIQTSDFRRKGFSEGEPERTLFGRPKRRR